MGRDSTHKGPKRPAKKPGPKLGKSELVLWLVAAGVGIAALAAIAIAIAALRSSSEVAAKPVKPSASPWRPICKNQSPALVNSRIARPTAYPMTIDRKAPYRALITTSCGTMEIKLFPREAPIAVNNFVHLVEDGFYLGQVFHRIDPSLGIVQAGDPGCPTSVETCGTGGPGYTIDDEFHNGLKPQVGTVAMASAGTPNSSGSQFFTVATKAGLVMPAERTIFGQLVGRHSLQVARLILSLPTKRAPNAPASAPADFPAREYVYITKTEIIKG
jgi:cyclophilin family peptidyl-prolyl cis-trans isomerase